MSTPAWAAACCGRRGGALTPAGNATPRGPGWAVAGGGSPLRLTHRGTWGTPCACCPGGTDRATSPGTRGPSASPAPTRPAQGCCTPWSGASSTSTSRPCTSASTRSPLSTSPAGPPPRVPLTLKLRPSRAPSIPSAALRGERLCPALLGTLALTQPPPLGGPASPGR